MRAGRSAGGEAGERRGDRDDREVQATDHDPRSRGHGPLRQAQGGPALHPRQGRVHRRPGPAGHALAGHRPQPVCARQDQEHRQRPRRSRSRAWLAVDHRQGPGEATGSTGCRPWPATCRWCCPSTLSCTRRRRWPRSSRPPLRRRRRRRRREGGLRAAAGHRRSVQGAWNPARSSSAPTGGRRSRTTTSGTGSRATRRPPTPPSRPPRSGRARTSTSRASTWPRSRPVAASPTGTPSTGT